MDNQKKIKRITATIWSGLSTKKQAKLAELYDKIIVTWQGDDELIVRHASKEPAQGYPGRAAACHPSETMQANAKNNTLSVQV